MGSFMFSSDFFLPASFSVTTTLKSDPNMFKIVTEKCHLFIKEFSALTDNAEHVFWRSFTKEDRAKKCMWVGRF